MKKASRGDALRSRCAPSPTHYSSRRVTCLLKFLGRRYWLSAPFIAFLRPVALASDHG